MVILAGGSGERFGGSIPKQFIKIAGKTVIEHTLEQVERSKVIDSVIVVVNKESYDYLCEIISKSSLKKVKKIVLGGNSRQASSYEGIKASDIDTVNLLFHDAIRPFVSERILEDTVNALDKYDAVDVAIPCADTIIQVDANKIIEDIPKRKYLMRGQTPQGFKKNIIEEAYRRFFADSNVEVTDDCGIVRYYNLADIYVVMGEEQNIKITYKEDAYLADKLFQMHSISGTCNEGNKEQLSEYLRGKTGIVFGASSGIGSDICSLLEKYQCKVYGYSRKNGCNICDNQQVKNAFEEVYASEGNIDFVINTAGQLKIGNLENMSIDDVSDLINVDYLGAVNVTKEAISYLRETKGSIILFTSSSYTRGRAMYSIYSSAKAAIVNFAQAVADELYADEIRVNVMNPERTDTPMRQNNFGDEPKDTLLSSGRVAEVTIQTLMADYTGQVIDIRKIQE